MTVPALDTSKVGTFAYIQPATSIQLADALPYFQAYQQYAEYVDGVFRIFDTGSQSPAPNNYCDVYVRIRTDGWMMAFFPRDIADPPASHAAWALSQYNNRGDLLWWGHTSSATGNPTTNATRLGRALSELWTAVKANSDNPTYVFSYADVGYYDYEYTTSAKIYIFGGRASINCPGYLPGGLTQLKYYYFTIPVGTTFQCVYANYGYHVPNQSYLKLNEGTAKEHIIFNVTGVDSNGFKTSDEGNYIYTGGIQNVVLLMVYCAYDGNPTTLSDTAMIILADG